MDEYYFENDDAWDDFPYVIYSRKRGSDSPVALAALAEDAQAIIDSLNKKEATA